MGARFRSTESGVLSEIVMLVFPLFARFLLFSARICLATLCFSISSCRDDVARVAGLALQGRCKVVVRVCVCGSVVVLFHVECCFIIVVASCEVTRHYGLVRGLNCNHPCGSAAGGNVGAVLPRFLLHRDMHVYVG